MNRGSWQATVHGNAKNQTRLSTHTYTGSTHEKLDFRIRKINILKVVFKIHFFKSICFYLFGCARS